MLLENLLAVTGGRLLNNPSISRFDSIELDASKVTHKALFIARLQNGIDKALSRGAYGIITDDEDIIITDKEIAWIYVKNIKATLVKLLRLWLLDAPRDIFYIPTQVLEFLKTIQSNPSIVLLNGDDEHKSKQILCSLQNQTIFCDDKIFLDHIGVKIVKPKTKKVDYKIIDPRVFETSLIIDEIYYNRLPLIPTMTPFLIEAIGVLKYFQYNYSIKTIEFTPSLEPTFVNSYCQKVDFGESDRVLVFASSNLKYKHLKVFENVKWIESKLIIPIKIKFYCDIKMSCFTWNLENELFEMVTKWVKKRGYTIIFAQNSKIFFEKLKRFNSNNRPILDQGLF